MLCWCVKRLTEMKATTQHCKALQYYLHKYTQVPGSGEYYG